jgi:hypothetical protein
LPTYAPPVEALQYTGAVVACRSDLYRLAGQGLMGPGVGSQPTLGPSRRLAVGCTSTRIRFWAWSLIKDRGRERVKRRVVGLSVISCVRAQCLFCAAVVNQGRSVLRDGDAGLPVCVLVYMPGLRVVLLPCAYAGFVRPACVMTNSKCSISCHTPSHVCVCS